MVTRKEEIVNDEDTFPILMLSNFGTQTCSEALNNTLSPSLLSNRTMLAFAPSSAVCIGVFPNSSMIEILALCFSSIITQSLCPELAAK